MQSAANVDLIRPPSQVPQPTRFAHHGPVVENPNTGQWFVTPLCRSASVAANSLKNLESILQIGSLGPPPPQDDSLNGPLDRNACSGGRGPLPMTQAKENTCAARRPNRRRASPANPTSQDGPGSEARWRRRNFWPDRFLLGHSLKKSEAIPRIGSGPAHPPDEASDLA